MVYGEIVYRGFDNLRAYVLVDIDVFHNLLSIVVQLGCSSLSDTIPGTMLRAGLWDAIFTTGLVLYPGLWSSCFVSMAIGGSSR